jgi:hypothetical protein
MSACPVKYRDEENVICPGMYADILTEGRLVFPRAKTQIRLVSRVLHIVHLATGSEHNSMFIGVVDPCPTRTYNPVLLCPELIVL